MDRSGLQDISNQDWTREGAAPDKQPRPSQMSALQLFLDVTEAGGVRGWTPPEDGVAGLTLEVSDIRKLRRHLETRLQRDPALRERWLEGLKEACADEEALHRALRPMTLPPGLIPGSVNSGGSGAGGCGSWSDSFLRCVLGVDCLQAPLATWLLQQLPVLTTAGGAGGDAGGDGDGAGAEAGGSIPGLILSQLRWLDVVPEASFLEGGGGGGAGGGGGYGPGGSPLVAVALEVLALVPPPLQRQMVGLLPEVATAEDHEVIYDKLSQLLDAELGFVAPCLEALQQLQLEQGLQDRVVSEMVDRLSGIEPDDLPAFVRFVVQYSTGPAGGTAGFGRGRAAAGAAGPSSSHHADGCDPSTSAGAHDSATAPTVIAALRAGLPLVDLSDPRLSVPVHDPKGKRGAAGGGGGRGAEAVEVRLLRELAVALAANDAAATAALKAITAAGRVRVGSSGSSAPDLRADGDDDEEAADEDGDEEAGGGGRGGRGGGGGRGGAAALAGGPNRLVGLDLWVLLALLGGRRGKEADKVLRAKIADGSASPAWLTSTLMGHPGALREFWPAAAALAAALAGAKPGTPAATAGARLYAILFAAMSDADGSVYRLEVIQALHTHLGSGCPEEVDTALEALSLLAEGPLSRPTPSGPGTGPTNGGGAPPAPALSAHGSALGCCLDHLDAFSDAQLAGLFGALAAVTGGAEGLAWSAREAAARGEGAPQGGVVRMPGGAGGRLEGEVAVVIEKALQGAAPYKRIGVAGALAFLARTGSALALLEGAGGGGPAPGGTQAGASQPAAPPNPSFALLLAEWNGRVDSLLAATESAPAARALAFTRMAELLQRTTGAGAGAAGGPQRQAHGQAAGGAAGGAEAVPWGLTLPKEARAYVLGVVQDLLEAAFIVNQSDLPNLPPVRVPGSSRTMRCSAWMNLDPQETENVAIRIWPLVGSLSPSERGALTWMAPCLRLVCTCTLQCNGDLSDVDALLGCPLVMPDLDVLQDTNKDDENHLHSMPAAASVAVITALQAACSWLREVLNCFGPSNAVRLQTIDQADNAQGKLTLRVANLAALEAAAAALLGMGEPRGGRPAIMAMRSHAEPLAPAAPIAAGTIGGAARPAAVAAAALAAAPGSFAAATAWAAELRRLVWPLSFDGVAAALRPLCVANVESAAGAQVADGSAGEPPAEPRGGGGKSDGRVSDWFVVSSKLAAAAYLASELSAKAAAVAARTTRAPPFARSAAAATARLDPSLARLTPRQMAATVVGLLPSFKRQMDGAAAALAGAKTSEIARDSSPGESGDGSRAVASIAWTQVAQDPANTGSQFMLHFLTVLRHLFTALAEPGAAGGKGAAASAAGGAAGGAGGAGQGPLPVRVLAEALAVLTAKPEAEGAPGAKAQDCVAAVSGVPAGRSLDSRQAAALAELAFQAWRQMDRQCRGTGPLFNHNDGPKPAAPCDVWRQLALLRAGRAMLAAVQSYVSQPSSGDDDADADGAPAEPPALRKLSRKISNAACETLELSWTGSGGDAGDVAGGDADADGDEPEAAAAAAAPAERAGGGGGGCFRWRGQAKLIRELLQLHIDLWRPNEDRARGGAGAEGAAGGGGGGMRYPLEALRHLVTAALGGVPPGKPSTGKGASAANEAPVCGYASLCVDTFPAWYRAAFEVLAEGQWAALCTRSKQAERKTMGQEEEDSHVSQLCLGAELFAALVRLAQAHHTRPACIGAAIRSGGKFVEDLRRSTGCWRRLWPRHEDRLRECVRSVQKGTRLLQTMCAEGKERRVAALAAKVPAVKRAIEGFNLNMRLLMHEMGRADIITMAQLRNKDIHGQPISSQVCVYGDGGGGGGFSGDEDDGDGEEAEPGEAAGGAYGGGGGGREKKKRGRAKKKPAAAEGADGGEGGAEGAEEGEGGARKKPRKPRAPKADAGEPGAPKPRKRKAAAASAAPDGGEEAAGAGAKPARKRKPKAKRAQEEAAAEEGVGMEVEEEGLQGAGAHEAAEEEAEAMEAEEGGAQQEGGGYGDEEEEEEEVPYASRRAVEEEEGEEEPAGGGEEGEGEEDELHGTGAHRAAACSEQYEGEGGEGEEGEGEDGETYL
ncbi:hypothetical protein HYH03_010675 [Edaphochlamys debaryana]|uniref:Uncharacterized protein n=1 Tax=Edaphochlamys debaryana TaxID=47281 RepID=A0A835XXU1_9CHLO|nr:hypothetical protein HYH03_010675 [Edaphochlamys debaryana]|eukprot:KAG2491003.1 hypothetical protein HYH03_010675 [Edaphochlamys debaryana]